MHLLFQILQRLDRKEMTRFKDFTLSPYFNKHEKLRSLVLHLNGIYPQFTEKSCSSKALAKAVFGAKEKEALQLPVLLTYTRRLLDQFLDIEGFRNSQLSGSVFLLAQLREKKQQGVHQKYLRQQQNHTAEEGYRDSNHYYKRYLLDKEADHQYAQQATKGEQDALQKKADHLDAYYLSEKLKDACEMLVRSRMVKVDYSSNLLEAILMVIQREPERYFQIPPINVYYHIYQMIVNDEAIHYEAAFEAAEKYAAYFPNEELQNIYNYLQNYCVNQINKGRQEFLRASFQLYQIQLDKQLLLINNLLPEWHYKNIVTAGLRLQEIEWVRNFLDQYRNLLPDDVQENAYAYNLAEYYYTIEEYKKAMSLLLKVTYTNARYSMGAKALLLRTYYDLEEEEALLALCKAFTQLLHRDKSISEFRRKGYKHLFMLTQKASQIRANLAFTKVEKSKIALEKLKKEMERLSPIFNQRWLEERVAKL